MISYSSEVFDKKFKRLNPYNIQDFIESPIKIIVILSILCAFEYSIIKILAAFPLIHFWIFAWIAVVINLLYFLGRIMERVASEYPCEKGFVTDMVIDCYCAHVLWRNLFSLCLGQSICFLGH